MVLMLFFSLHIIPRMRCTLLPFTYSKLNEERGKGIEQSSNASVDTLSQSLQHEWEGEKGTCNIL